MSSDDVTCIFTEIFDTKTQSFVDLGLREKKNKEMFGDQKRKSFVAFFFLKKVCVFCDDSVLTRPRSKPAKCTYLCQRETPEKKTDFFEDPTKRKNKIELGKACIIPRDCL